MKKAEERLYSIIQDTVEANVKVLNDIKSKLLNTKQLMQTNVEETIKYIDEQLKSDRPAEDKKLDIEDFLIDVRL